MSSKVILGVKFLSGSAAEAVEAGLRGGLVVVPSAPVLVGIEKDPALHEAVIGADLAITDSGLMVLLWWLLKREKLERVSGLEYLQLLLGELKRREAEGERREATGGTATSAGPTTDFGRIFWIMPTVAARDQNLAWLRSQGFSTTADDCYIAPKYPASGPLSDQQLSAIIQQRKPSHIIIALGGGVQERLGFALRQNLEKAEGGKLKAEVSDPSLVSSLSAFSLQPSAFPGPFRPGIHCIGAAIGFLSGEQVRIPMWVDYLYLGWLWRSMSAPSKFVPRYWKAARLIPLMMRYGAKAPTSGERGAGS